MVNSALLVHETVKRVEQAVTGMQEADAAARNGKLRHFAGRICSLRDQLTREDRTYQQILKWLSSANYSVQQADLINRCQEGTGHWFLESPECAAWLEGSNRTLFCPGIPGGGKTFMTAIVVDTLHRRFPGSNVGIAALYCNYKMREEQNARSFLAGLLRQLVNQEHAQSQQTQTLVEQCKKADRRPSFNELADLLRFVAATFRIVFIVVDALDECRNDQWPQLMSQLWLLQRQLPAVRLMATARPQPALDNEFKDAMKVSIQAHEVDLRTYLDNQIPKLSLHVVRTPCLKEEVVRGIIQAANGM